MKKLLITSTLLICFIANSQCIKGDCDDGIGTKKYNLTGTKGTYEGEFKNKFPEGLGKYTYENLIHKNLYSKLELLNSQFFHLIYYLELLEPSQWILFPPKQI